MDVLHKGICGNGEKYNLKVQNKQSKNRAGTSQGMGFLDNGAQAMIYKHL